tara:strand:- start:2971 stop:3186 length:216 start_codon:yes stop_codon:yes gene_type:complete
MEAPPGFEPGMEVLQTSALPLGDGAILAWTSRHPPIPYCTQTADTLSGRKYGAGNGIRTRDFDLGKVALYH